MKKFELTYLGLRYLLPPLHSEMRRSLLNLASLHHGGFEVLDVGGRKSHCTIGVPGLITITELPRETEIQHTLNLGITEKIIDQIAERRSNVRRAIYDDMTHSALPDNSFDCVLAVEVIEHVEEDDFFVREIHRVLKPGGWFLMSTPNGDFVPNRNPDHKRHYTREQLQNLLARHFARAEVEYAIKGGRCHKLGLQPWSVRRPMQTALSMIGNLVNHVQSSSGYLKNQPLGTHHLIARSRKRGG